MLYEVITEHGRAQRVGEQAGALQRTAVEHEALGQQKAKENLVEKIDNASRGLEASKRLFV